MCYTFKLTRIINFNRRGKVNIPMIYLQRYIRLTPIVAATILVTSTILWRLGDGPLWHILIDIGINCENTWWSALLYIQNYYNPDRIVSMAEGKEKWENLIMKVSLFQIVFGTFMVFISGYATFCINTSISICIV